MYFPRRQKQLEGVQHPVTRLLAGSFQYAVPTPLAARRPILDAGGELREGHDVPLGDALLEVLKQLKRVNH